MERTPFKSDDNIKIYEMASNSDGTDSNFQFASEFESTPNSKVVASGFKKGSSSIRSNFEMSAIKDEA